MKPFILLFAAAILSAPVMAEAADSAPGPTQETPAIPGQEPGIYRFGSTYQTSAEESASACQALCGSDNACMSWSYVMAVGDGAARCELKRGGGRVERNLSAISGISPRHEAMYTPAPEPSDLMGGPDALPGAPSGKPDIAGPTPLSADTSSDG